MFTTKPLSAFHVVIADVAHSSEVKKHHKGKLLKSGVQQTVANTLTVCEEINFNVYKGNKCNTCSLMFLSPISTVCPGRKSNR